MNRLGVFWRGARYRLDPVWPVLRWLLSTLVVLFGVSLLAFVLTYLTPGDLAENILTSQGITPTAEMVAAMRDRLGQFSANNEENVHGVSTISIGWGGSCTGTSVPRSARAPISLRISVADCH